MLNRARSLQPLLGDENGEYKLPLDEFAAGMAEEVEELAGTPFGAMLLYTIGALYSAKAKVWLGRHDGWGVYGELEALKLKGRSIGLKVRCVWTYLVPDHIF
jgi:hypothetical protein